MPGDLGGVQHRALIKAYPTEILEAAHNGCKGGGLLQDGVNWCSGVMQEEPLSPTNFNVVVDAVVRHWVSVVV